jgi:hypothetical protein
VCQSRHRVRVCTARASSVSSLTRARCVCLHTETAPGPPPPGEAVGRAGAWASYPELFLPWTSPYRNVTYPVDHYRVATCPSAHAAKVVACWQAPVASAGWGGADLTCSLCPCLVLSLRVRVWGARGFLWCLCPGCRKRGCLSRFGLDRYQSDSYLVDCGPTDSIRGCDWTVGTSQRLEPRH